MQQEENPSPRFLSAYPDQPCLLVSDIDGTLLGDETGEKWFREFISKRPGNFKLAYSTGRYVSSVLELVKENRVPRPDFICGDVGTELLDCNDSENKLGKKYVAQVSPDWDLETLYILGEGEGIRRQDFALGQPPFQAGFDWDGQIETLTAFQRRFADQKDCHILPSFSCYIDVLPAPLGKGEVAKFLQKELGLNPEHVVVAGDGGNDTEMFETGFKGIVPANALDELKTVACESWHYHSSLPAARGVLEGLCYFGFLKQEMNG
jgi:hydroxymethylpyrimidine pyrophosphatase-like HAD family hydrolase